MLKESADTANALAEKENASESGSIKFSLKLEEIMKIEPAKREESLSLDATDDRNISRLVREVNSVFDGTMKTGDSVLVGKPSSILSHYLKSENPLYMPQSAVKKTALPAEVKGGKHNLGVGVIYELPYQFADPMAITKNTKKHQESNDNSVVVWTDWMTNAGDSVIVPIRIDVNGQMGVYNNVNTEFDAFSKPYAEELLARENILYTRENKNIQELSAQRRKVPKVKVSDVYNGSISQNSDLSIENAKKMKKLFPRAKAGFTRA